MSKSLWPGGIAAHQASLSFTVSRSLRKLSGKGCSHQRPLSIQLQNSVSGFPHPALPSMSRRWEEIPLEKPSVLVSSPTALSLVRLAYQPACPCRHNTQSCFHATLLTTNRHKIIINGNKFRELVAWYADICKSVEPRILEEASPPFHGPKSLYLALDS